MTQGPDGGDVYDAQAEPTWIGEGDVGARVLSPFSVRVDAGAENDVTTVVVGEAAVGRPRGLKW